MSRLPELVVLLMISSSTAAAAQEESQAVYLQRNHAACFDYRAWADQDRVRHENPVGWFEFLDPLLASRQCWMTGEEQLVYLLDVDEGGHAIRVTRSMDDDAWWIAAEAVLP